MVKIKTETWHMTLAKMGDPYIDISGRSDLCHYLRAVTFGVLKWLMLHSLIIVFAWGLLSLVLWLVVSLCVTWFELPVPAMIGLGVIFSAVLLGTLAGINYFTTESKATSPIRAAYRGWKEKHCPLVEFER